MTRSPVPTQPIKVFLYKRGFTMRADGRVSTQIRPLRFITNFTKNPAGSVMIEMGGTTVLCNVSVENGVPSWLRQQRHQRGWLTAEYCMIPSATDLRNKRERGHTSGRSQEIQRLIGRSLRGIIDLKKCPDTTFVIDCEVLQADGGTRVASINGAWVALKLAVNKAMASGRIKENPILDNIAAMSVGIKNDELLVDLDYSEDSVADVDMSIIMTQNGKIQEVQCSSEGNSFTQNQLNEAISNAENAIQEIVEAQNAALEEVE